MLNQTPETLPQTSTTERALVGYYITDRCRRLELSIFMDGIGIHCWSGCNELCDVCHKKSASTTAVANLARLKEGQVIRAQSSAAVSALNLQHIHEFC